MKLNKINNSNKGKKEVDVFNRYFYTILCFVMIGAVTYHWFDEYQTLRGVSLENINLEVLLLKATLSFSNLLTVFIMIMLFRKYHIGKQLQTLSDELPDDCIVMKKPDWPKVSDVLWVLFMMSLFIVVMVFISLGESLKVDFINPLLLDSSTGALDIMRLKLKINMTSALMALGYVMYFTLNSALLVYMVFRIKRQRASFEVLKNGVSNGLGVQMAVSLANCSFGKAFFEVKEKITEGHAAMTELRKGCPLND